VASSLRATVVPKLGWSAGGQLIVEAAKLVTTVVLARILGPDPFGALAIFLVIVGYGRVLTGLGLAAPLIQRRDLAPEDRSSALWITIVLGAVCGVGVVAAGPRIASAYGLPVLASLCTLAGVTIVLSAAGLVQRALAYRSLRHREVAIVDSSAAILGSTVGIGLALRGHGADALAWMFVVRAGLQTAGLWLASKDRVLGPWTLLNTRRMVGFSAAVATSHAVRYGADNIDRALIGGVAPAAELAVYDQAARLVMAPVNLLTSVLYRVAFPVFSTIQSDGARVAAAWRRGLGMTSAVAFPAGIGMIAIAHPLILTVFGEAWLPMVPMIRILGLVPLMTSFNALVPSVLYARDRAGLELKANLAGRAAIVVLVVGALPLGIVAIAWARVAGEVVASLVNLWCVARCVPTTLGAQLAAMRTSALHAGLMGVATWALTLALTPHVPAFAALFAAVVFGVVVYGALAKLLSNPPAEELAQILRAALAAKT
jgi:teichuronic acid exporter